MKNKITTNYLFKSIFIPLLLLTLYFGIYKVCASIINIEGVNTVFTSRTLNYLLALTSMVLVTLIFVRIKSKEKILLGHEKLDFNPRTFLLILLPLTPVVQYIVTNSGILSSTDVILILLFFVLFSLFFIILIPIAISSLSSFNTLAAIGIAFATTITSMAMLSKQFYWYFGGSLKIQLLYLFVLYGLAWLFLHLKDQKVVYFIVLFFFIANTSFQIINKVQPDRGNTQSVIDQKMNMLVSKHTLVRNPNVYLLIFDSYVGSETLLSYGIDNSAQENFLSENGFKIYPKTYSTGAATLETMRAVYQLSPDYFGESRSGVSGDGIVQKTFSDNGYKTVGIFEGDYFFKGAFPSYDETFPSYDETIPKYVNTQFKYVITAILIGEFRFDLEFTKQTHQDFVNLKETFFKNASDEKLFVYAHSGLPNHSQNSGACLANETELYEERIMRANEEMTKDVETLLKADPEAIIIIAGDHGPYLTKNCYYTGSHYSTDEIDRLDLQDRFGAFLAIRWPDNGYTDFDQITVIQDLFPVVFSYLFDSNDFMDLRVAPISDSPSSASGAYIDNGIIQGGVNDQEPLFLSE